jgi:hypothetical protein
LNGVTKKVTLFGEQNFTVSHDPQICKDPSKMKQVGVSGKFGYTDVLE